MKKMFLTTIVLFIASFVFSAIPSKFCGYYLPESYLTKLKSTKSHILSIDKSNSNIFDVVYIVENKGVVEVYSNKKFADLFKVDTKEFEVNMSKFDANTIYDSKNNKYIKISDNKTLGGNDVERYIVSNIFSKNSYKSGKNTLEINNGIVKYNGVDYTINLSVFFNKTNVDEYFSKIGDKTNYILIELKNDSVIVSSLEKNIEKGDKILSTVTLK